MLVSSSTLGPRSLLLLCSITLALASTLNAQVTEPTQRDTVVVVRRDTVVMIRKDTVFFQQVEDEEEERPRSRGRGGSGRSDEEVLSAREERLALREQRLAEWEAWVAEQPIRRVNGVSYAYKFYPTQLLNRDFPTLGFAAERTVDGKYSLEGQFGFVLRPFDLNNWGGFEPGTARYGLRGLRFGLGGRMYFGEAYKRFPFYVGADVSYAITPVEIDLWIPVEAGEYRQLLSAPVNGHSTKLSGFTGWELRTDGGLTVDFSTGLALGVKGIRTRNDFVAEAIDRQYWNLPNNGRTLYADVVLRIGVGFGDWQPANAVSKKSSRKGRGKKRRRGRSRRG